MSAHTRTLATIEAFYDAALDESLWPGALRRLADLTDSQAASLWALGDANGPSLPTFISINFDQRSISEYLAGMAALDPTVRYLVDHPQQRIVHDGLFIDQRDRDTRAYYDWHERNVETRFRLVGQTRPLPAVQAGVALHRTRKVGRYEREDIERFSLLERHLARSLAIGFKLGTLGSMQPLSTERLDHNDAATVLLDAHRRVLFINRAAEALQSRADGIRLSATHGLALARKQDDDKLQALIARALRSGNAVGGSMRAFKPGENRRVDIFVTPVTGAHPAVALSQPAVCIVITHPDREPRLPVDRLRAAFGFTPAEARLAALLADGAALRSAATKLGITYGTARTRLAQIFQKCGVRRQAELTRLMLLTLAAAERRTGWRTD